MSLLYFLTYSESSPSAYVVISSTFLTSFSYHISDETSVGLFYIDYANLSVGVLGYAADNLGAVGAATFAFLFFLIALSFDPIFFSHFSSSPI